MTTKKTLVDKMFKYDKHVYCANKCRSEKCNNCSKVGHIMKFCLVEKKKKNILIEEDDEK